jgi:hypothetical protein
VASSPPGISCGADCTEVYNAHTQVTLTATPASGSVFSSWAGCTSTTATCTVAIENATSVTATFGVVHSCADLHVSNPAAGDGVYTIDLGAGPIQVFCDMTHGGITYEQLAFGNSLASYPGYTPISTADLNDPVGGQAFAALFNLQGFGLINIDTVFTTGNCCIKAADSGAGTYLALGGHVVFPAGLDGSGQCLPNYPAAKFSFQFIDNAQNAPNPMPADFFVTNPASNKVQCGDSNNPGWFFKRF